MPSRWVVRFVVASLLLTFSVTNGVTEVQFQQSNVQSHDNDRLADFTNVADFNPTDQYEGLTQKLFWNLNSHIRSPLKAKESVDVSAVDVHRKVADSSNDNCVQPPKTQQTSDPSYIAGRHSKSLLPRNDKRVQAAKAVITTNTMSEREKTNHSASTYLSDVGSRVGSVGLQKKVGKLHQINVNALQKLPKIPKNDKFLRSMNVTPKIPTTNTTADSNDQFSRHLSEHNHTDDQSNSRNELPSPAKLVSSKFVNKTPSNEHTKLFHQMFQDALPQNRLPLGYDAKIRRTDRETDTDTDSQNQHLSELALSSIFHANHRQYSDEEKSMINFRFQSGLNSPYQQSSEDHQHNSIDRQETYRLQSADEDNYPASVINPLAQVASPHIDSSSNIYYYYYPVTEEKQPDQQPAAEAAGAAHYPASTGGHTAQQTGLDFFGENPALLEIHQVVTAVAVPLMFVAGSLGLLVLVTTLVSPNFTLGRQLEWTDEHGNFYDHTINNNNNSSRSSSSAWSQMLPTNTQFQDNTTIYHSEKQKLHGEFHSRIISFDSCEWSVICWTRQISMTLYERVFTAVQIARTSLEKLATLRLADVEQLFVIYRQLKQKYAPTLSRVAN